MAWRITSEEIDVTEQRVLEENEAKLLQYMNMDSVCYTLLQHAVLNDMDVHNILQQSSKKDKVHNFILRLAMRGEKAFHDFMDILRDSSNPNHVYLAAILEDSMKIDEAKGDDRPETPPTKATSLALKEHDCRIRHLEERSRTGDEAERFELLLEEMQGLKLRVTEQEHSTSKVKEENDKLQKRVTQLEREIFDLQTDKSKWQDEAKRLRLRLQVLEQKNVVLDHEHKVLEQEQEDEKDQLLSLEEQVGQLSARIEAHGDASISPPSRSRPTIQPANRFQHANNNNGRGGTNSSRSPMRQNERGRREVSNNSSGRDGAISSRSPMREQNQSGMREVSNNSSERGGANRSPVADQNQSGRKEVNKSPTRDTNMAGRGAASKSPTRERWK